MNNYCVYMHISPSNKKYIGITSMTPNKRWRSGKGYINNQYFYRAIEKYGWDNFQHIIIARGLTEDEAKWLEIELIRVNNTTVSDKGYNISLGGEGGNGLTGDKCYWYGKHHTEESRKKISKNHADVSGENHPMYGKHHSEESKRKLSESRKGKCCGENNPSYGKTGKLSNNAKAVICITTKAVFYTAKEAGEYYNINYKGISECLNGRQKSAGKYNGEKLVWRYINIIEL